MEVSEIEDETDADSRWLEELENAKASVSTHLGPFLSGGLFLSFSAGLAMIALTSR